MRIVAATLFVAYLGFAALLVILLAVGVGNWHPGYTATADQVLFGMLFLLGPFFLGIFIGKHQS